MRTLYICWAISLFQSLIRYKPNTRFLFISLLSQLPSAKSNDQSPRNPASVTDTVNSKFTQLSSTSANHAENSSTNPAVQPTSVLSQTNDAVSHSAAVTMTKKEKLKLAVALCQAVIDGDTFRIDSLIPASNFKHWINIRIPCNRLKNHGLDDDEDLDDSAVPCMCLVHVCAWCGRSCRQALVCTTSATCDYAALSYYI